MDKRNESAKRGVSRNHRANFTPRNSLVRPEVGPCLALRIRRQPATISTFFNRTLFVVTKTD
jgi:hypothetical protein